jgi:hypothetical protein
MRRWSVILLLVFAGGGLAYFVAPWLRLSPGAQRCRVLLSPSL